MDTPSDQQSTNNHQAQSDIKTTDTKNRTVRFNEAVLRRSVPCLNDYSDEEIERCFLTAKEMDKTLDRIAKVAQRMESGKRPRHGSSYRGLENATVEGETEYYYNRQDVVESVLHEQERQYNEDFCDEDLIAKASEIYSEVALATALRRAKSDAREAKRAYRQMEDIYKPCTEGSASSLSYVEDDLTPILKTGSDIFLQEDARIISPRKLQPMRAFS